MIRKVSVLILVAVLFSSVVNPVVSSHDTELIELRGLAWDEGSNEWRNCVSLDKGKVARFKVSITYHDPDGEGSSYKIKWITILLTLPDGIEYLNNATTKESEVSGDTITWSNISDVELLDGDTFSLEFDVRVLDYGLHLSEIEILAFETCPRVWHSKSVVIILYTINPPKSRDTDSDGREEFAFDADEIEENGYESYIDPDDSSNATLSIDGDDDGKIDHFIDTDKNGLPNRYWDPDDDILCDVVLKDIDNDGTLEWIYDSDGDGRPDRYYDDGKIYPYNEEEPFVEIVKPEKYYLYKNGVKRRYALRTIVIGPIEVQVNASESVREVEFYVDEELMHIDNETPYTWNWSSSPLGKCRLEVIGYDDFGRSSSANLTVWRYKYNIPLLKGLLLAAGITVGITLLTKILENLKEKEEPPLPPKPEPEPNQPPIADAGGPYSGYINTAICFNGSESSDPDGSIVKYTWSFGDGSTDTGKEVSHIYDKPGNYTIILVVTDNDGATSSDSAIVTVYEIPPTPKKDESFWYAVAGLSASLLLAMIVLLFRRNLFE
jgi:hypothetical protein